jgi:hypothetical protein
MAALLLIVAIMHSAGSLAAADSLIVIDTEMVPGQNGYVPIFLRNGDFAVGGINLRLELPDTLNFTMLGAEAGEAIRHFEYFGATPRAGYCRITTIYNIPGGDNPPPLQIGRHEIVRLLVQVDSLAQPGIVDSLIFRNDTIPPDYDNSISDSSGYISRVPVLAGGIVRIVSLLGLDGPSGPPKQFDAIRNYPNPFNAETRLAFALGEPAADVALEIFDVLGRSVRAFELGNLAAGEHGVTWDGTDRSGAGVASGVYFYRLHSSRFASDVQRMTLLR